MGNVIQDLGPLTIVGIEARTSNSRESDPATSRIGPLWRRFYGEKILDRIPGRTSPGTVIAAYTAYESDHRGEYTIVVGAEVASGAQAPEGLTRLVIPRAGYVPFVAKGEMPAALIGTWQQIWKHFDDRHAVPRLYTTDFEVHRPDGQVDVHVAVLKTAVNRPELIERTKAGEL